jgi:hypothetical protein
MIAQYIFKSRTRSKRILGIGISSVLLFLRSTRKHSVKAEPYNALSRGIRGVSYQLLILEVHLVRSLVLHLAVELQCVAT